MRIRRLDLVRYGKFTDRSLDFGERRAGEPDLHIIYGPNEAGKSTTLAAWLDLLFGIEQQTRYSFLHQGPTMRIGALLEMGGRELAVTRIKTRSNALLDNLGAPLPEAVLQGGLGGMGRAAYQSMFSLDDETLVEGGESILASQGDLGELLFSSSAGLTGLSRKLKALQNDAEGFIRTARTGRLFDLKKQLEGLEADRKAIDVQAPEHARRTDGLATAERSWALANTALAAANSRLAMLSRVDAGRPLAWRLAKLTDAEAADSAAVVPPAGWRAEWTDLIGAKASATARAEVLRASIRRLTLRLSETPVDAAVLDLAGPIAAADALRSGHDEAIKDLPSRSQALLAEDATIAALMAQLGRAGQTPEDILLPAARVAALRALIAAQSGLHTGLTTAEREVIEAKSQVQDAEARLADAGGVGDADALATLLGAVRLRDPGHALRQARGLTVAAQAALADRLALLAPWQGTAAMLAQQTVPHDDQLRDWSKRGDTAQRALAEAGANLRRLQADQARHLAVLAARALSGRVSPDDLAAARQERERLWALHLTRLEPVTARDFEVAMRLDDQAAADRAAVGAEQAVLAQAREAAAVVTSELAEAERTLARAESAMLAHASAWAGLLHAISATLPPAWDVTDLRAWLALRDQAIRGVSEVARLEGVQLLAEAEVADATADLRAALGVLTAEPLESRSLDALIAMASALVAVAGKRAALAETVATARRLAQRRQDDHARALAATDDWLARWDELCAGTWLATDGPPDPVMAARQIATMEELRAALASRRSLADRVDKMAANRAAFRDAVAGLAGALRLEGAETTAAWQAITRRLRLAQDARAAADSATADLAEQTAQLAAQDDIHQIAERRLQTMAAFLGVEGADAVGAALDAAAERVLRQQEIAGLQHDLVQTMRSASLPEAIAAIAAAEGQDLDALLSEARSTADAAQNTTQTCYADLARARAALDAIGGDDAVARLEEARQTILLQIEEDAQRHLRHRFGIIAVEHALRAYRDSHRSAMMSRASAGFRTISRGAYTGLASQPDKDREVLVALAADGTSKLAPDLSKGTRFQLYLALRAAGYHVLAEARPPVPFVADDIMETFDDDRSAEAFALLGDMAGVGQVIYLTHHRHLCEIARKVCPSARFQELG